MFVFIMSKIQTLRQTVPSKAEVTSLRTLDQFLKKESTGRVVLIWGLKKTFLSISRVNELLLYHVDMNPDLSFKLLPFSSQSFHVFF